MNIEYTLKRSARKTVAIHVKDGKVEVRAPLRMPVTDIDRFVSSKEKWITAKMAQTRLMIEKRKKFTLEYGSLLVYRGGSYPIVGRAGSVIGFDEDEMCFYMPENLTPEQIKVYSVEIYKLLAKRDITDRVCELSKGMRISPCGVRINSARTRWGSCSSKRTLNFSWMLLMADDDAIDYVIVHELAHILQMDHSPRFWAIVESFIPNFEDCRTRLKILQQRLIEEDWT